MSQTFGSHRISRVLLFYDWKFELTSGAADTPTLHFYRFSSSVAAADKNIKPGYIFLAKEVVQRCASEMHFI